MLKNVYVIVEGKNNINIIEVEREVWGKDIMDMSGMNYELYQRILHTLK